MYQFEGKHILAEFYGVPTFYLNNSKNFIKVFNEGIMIDNLSNLGTIHKNFTPQGLPILILLSESHISIHTYPEHNSFFMDIFTCGNKDPSIVLNHLKKSIEFKTYSSKIIKRGNYENVL
ncbi:MAG: adenosylmethionine decarboxylase [Fusobacteriaceae bacterium]